MINVALLKENEIFSNSIKKLFLNKELNRDELAFLLSCVILFLKKYEKDNREKSCLSFAYFILLKVALVNNYYLPLYDISINMGWYPISRFIFEKELIDDIDFSQIVADARVDKYEFEGIIETYKQKNNRIDLLNSDIDEKAYIAPTSFGKSKLIQEFLKRQDYKKIAIIVPTKSLLTQTFNTIKELFAERKIIFHDEMYQGENNFIAIFTQERALRLLSKNKNLSFDLLVIDEAHNLMDSDVRSILLLRLIRRNKFRNNDCNILYLSPLISNVDNIKFSSSQNIYERKIEFNIKEPSINLYDSDKTHYLYNRYFDNYYEVKNYSDYLDYIFAHKKNKNFFYLRKPKSVEQLAASISLVLSNDSDKELQIISESLAQNVHKDFYCVDYIKKGLLYLHGKLPDIIKEYLEYKFKTLSKIKYLVSNSVILEGVNLPIDNLYILNTYSLDSKKLINLVGRVNRLNEVFDKSNNDLNKLNPDIHFVYDSYFTGESAKLRNTIKKIKSGVFKDKVDNPVLLNYDSDERKLDGLGGDNVEDISSENIVKMREDFLIFNDLNDDFKFKFSLIESNIDSIYLDFDSAYQILENKFINYKLHTEWSESNIIDKISFFFIDGMEEYISDKNLLRLNNEKARNFYKMFNDNRHKFNVNQNIKSMLTYFYSIRDSYAGKNFYVGASYGEFSITDNSFSKNYINLSTKDEKELVNIALIKIKIESDFLSFVLYKFANVLYDIGLVGEDEYNLFTYGSISKESNDYIRLGLSSNIVASLERNDQLKNLLLSRNGTVKSNDKFKEFFNKQDDLFKFEISKFIS